MNAPRLFTDTTEFAEIEFGDEIKVGDQLYRVTGMEKERRFGVEDPKFWVKRAVHTQTGERKIIKLSYLEAFDTTLGGVTIRCFRSPDKEADILDLVQGHPSFMQGRSYRDPKGNCIRLLDIVRGPNFFVHTDTFRMPHKKYLETVLPGVLEKLVSAFEAIRFLHLRGFRHGDIRNDHLIIDQRNGRYVWIDFDYDFDSGENPFSLDIFGLGNILAYAVGKGFHNMYMIKNDRYTYGDLIDRVTPDDLSILQGGRFLNLRKLYPYIPRMLNDIIMHFSCGTSIYYEFIDEMLEDLKGFLRSL